MRSPLKTQGTAGKHVDVLFSPKVCKCDLILDHVVYCPVLYAALSRIIYYSTVLGEYKQENKHVEDIFCSKQRQESKCTTDFHVHLFFPLPHHSSVFIRLVDLQYMSIDREPKGTSPSPKEKQLETCFSSPACTDEALLYIRL